MEDAVEDQSFSSGAERSSSKGMTLGDGIKRFPLGDGIRRFDWRRKITPCFSNNSLMEDAVEDQSFSSDTGRSSSKRMRSGTKLKSKTKRLKKDHCPSDLSMENILKGEARELLDNQADVSFTLAKHLMLNHGKDTNLVFSPISIQVILALVAAGSSSQTLEQLLTFLKAKTIDDLNHLYSHLVALVLAKSSDDLCFSFANGVWVDKSVSFKRPFKHVVDTLYEAASQTVDFRNKAEDVIKSVNSWVEEETMGLIKQILSPGSIDSLTRLIFANALYFKGKWDSGFDKSETKRFKFHLLSGDSIKVPFMRSKKNRYIQAFDGFKVLNLPYRRGLYKCLDKRYFSMYIFLPDAKDGLPALVEKAGSESGFLERHIPSEKVEVGEFRIPKFKFEYEIEVTQALQKLGLVSPFDPKEGLSEMVNDHTHTPLPLVVSNIFHKSFIQVDEKGAEAAAATVAKVRLTTCYTVRKFVPIDFVADHPFLFVIRENTTGVAQFIGQVLNPSLK